MEDLAEQIYILEKLLMNYKYSDLDCLLADDFLEFGSSGCTYDKKMQLNTAKETSTNNSRQYTVTDFKIKLLANDIVLATYQTYRHNDSKYALRSSIWKKVSGKWQMVFHQGTPII